MSLQKKIAGFILDLKRRLGKGAYGEVYLAIDTSNSKFVAVKQIAVNGKNQQSSDQRFNQIINEINIMKQIDNPNVVKLINVQRTSNNLYLVMEFCNQGTLEEYIRKKTDKKQKLSYLSEQEAKLFLKQIINGFRSLNQAKIVHRDLKLQNILIHDGEAKIADFGFGKVIECEMEATLLRTYAGSPLYMSYQILKEQNYSSKCDIWSLGVVFYEMLYGQPPWLAVSIPDLINKIENYPLKFPDRPYVSSDSKTLIQKMLQKDEQSRIGWEELFNHPFFNEKMEIEEEQNLKATVSKIDGQYKNDKLRLSNAKKKLYFENNNVIQNVQHAAKQQKRMQKIFEMPSQSPTPKSTANNQSNMSNQSRNRIFEQRRDRSISPNSQQNQQLLQNNFLQRGDSSPNRGGQQDQNFVQVFRKNQQDLENKKVIQLISDWVIHRRNKSVFLNNLSQKWFDFYESGALKLFVTPTIYYRILFLLTKYQTTIFFKMNRRLESKQIEKFTKFSKEQWDIFVRSEEFKTTAGQIFNDFFVVKGFLKELVDRARENLEIERNNPMNQNVLSICDMNMIDKQYFDPIFFENLSFVSQAIKQILQNGIAQLRNQDELQLFMNSNKELIVFATHVNNGLRMKDVFKFNVNKPVDFFKYYEEIENENPARLAHLLGIL